MSAIPGRSTLLPGPGDNYSILFIRDAEGNITYVGRARPGTAQTDQSWQIYKLTYTSSLMTSKLWANGSDDFNKIWTNYASYTYS